MTAAEARRRFAGARVARLASIGPGGVPHLVPITFALVGEVVCTAVDDVKRKRSTALARLANIAANPAVSMLADHYAERWAELWWVRADGRARILEGSAAEEALDALAERYEPYRRRRPPGPVIAIDVTRWVGWSASGD